MLAKIAITKRQRTVAKVSLFWRKTINQIAHTLYFCPTFFNLETLTYVSLDCMIVLSLTLSHNAELVFALVLAFARST
jgi:hypothetical protein